MEIVLNEILSEIQHQEDKLSSQMTQTAESHLSCDVALPVQISNLFLSDLKQLASLAV
ncbi:MAG: hypothetical protein KF870_09800 [Leadbetterella sp.]|nr:hypothetical protein [Leadbetterella sp.]